MRRHKIEYYRYLGVGGADLEVARSQSSSACGSLVSARANARRFITAMPETVHEEIEARLCGVVRPSQA
jgi:hypothetical protein